MITCKYFLGYHLISAMLLIDKATELTASAFNTSHCLNAEDCLLKDLFKTYNKKIRPVQDPLSTVDIGVTLVVNSLQDIIWTDEFLRWNASEYGNVDHLIIPAENVWLPDIAISNSATHFYDISYKRDFYIEIQSNGLIRWSFGGIFTTNCNMQLEKYPFDVQRCPIEIENWMYAMKDVNLKLNPIATEVDNIRPNAVWHFSTADVERSIKYEKFVSITFLLAWKRKTLYYYINIVIPIVLMVLVALGVFWLPADCGEKMSLAISIVLAFSVFQIIVMENTPVNSDVVPGMTSLVMLVSVLATTSLLTSMLVVYISNKCSNNRPPNWLRNICCCFAKALLMTCAIEKSTNEAQEVGNQKSIEDIRNSHENHTNGMDMKPTEISSIAVDVSPYQEELAGIRSSINHIVDILTRKEKSDIISDEWKFIAKVVDRCIFWVVSILFTATFLYLFLRYM